MNSEFSDLLQFLSAIEPISESEWQKLEEKCELVSVEAGSRLASIGEPVDSVYFVRSGLLKTSYLNVDGKEITKGFSWEGRLAAPYASMLTRQTSNINITALETAELVVIQYSFLTTLFDAPGCWQVIGRRIAESLLVEREHREFQLLTLSAEHRYKSFLSEHQHLLNRIPQYEIASYLGITPVALSNIKKRLSQA